MKSLKEKIEVMQAYLDGEKIEHRMDDTGEWKDVYNAPYFQWGEWDYRIKPKPMEIWVNIYADGDIFGHRNKDSAKSALISDSGNVRLAVKFIEVTD